MSEYKSEENWLNNAPLTVVDVDSLHFCLESWILGNVTR